MPLELSALTTTLAQMYTEHIERHKSLKDLVRWANAMDHYPDIGVADDAPTAWCSGFYTAMAMIMAHIDNGTPPRPAASIKHPR
jgi:hypothetical protein